MLDTRTGELPQLTKDPSEDYMPTWSPDDREIAFASTRENGQSVWAVIVADRRRAQAGHGQRRARRRAVVGTGRPDRLSRHRAAARAATRSTASRITGSENVFAFRASWASPTEFFYVSDGKIRKRAASARAAADGRVHGDAAGDAAAVHAPRARLHVDDAAQGARHRPAGDLARRHADRLRRRRRHLRHAGRRRQAGQPDQRRGARHRSVVVARRRSASSTRRTRTARICSSGFAT